MLKFISFPFHFQALHCDGIQTPNYEGFIAGNQRPGALKKLSELFKNPKFLLR